MRMRTATTTTQVITHITNKINLKGTWDTAWERGGERPSHSHSHLKTVAVGDSDPGAEAGTADGAEEGEDCALERGGP